METNPGSSSQPTPPKTRRRLPDYENEDGGGAADLINSRRTPRQPVGCFFLLRRRTKSLLKYFGRGTKSISLLVLVLFVLVTTSTISIKIMLMNRFSSVEDDDDIEDFEDFPSRPPPLKKSIFESETTSHTAQNGNSTLEGKTHEIWKKPPSDNFYKCPYNPKLRNGKNLQSNGYILIHANGGLNQMRAGIADMVAVAKIMNGVLILPALDHTSYWSDPSGFKDIFDWKYFIESLDGDVEVLESLPSSLAEFKPFKKVPVSWSKASYYRDLVPLLKRHRVIKFMYSDSRLANNGLMPAIQKLRCHALYEALRFSNDIEQVAQKLINRLRELDNHYVALHLRYDSSRVGLGSLLKRKCDQRVESEESNNHQDGVRDADDLLSRRVNMLEKRLKRLKKQPLTMKNENDESIGSNSD